MQEEIRQDEQAAEPMGETTLPVKGAEPATAEIIGTEDMADMAANYSDGGATDISAEAQMASAADVAAADAAAVTALGEAAAQFDLPVERLVALLLESRQEYESAATNRRNERLAEEFAELAAAAPEFIRFADVPEAVVQTALDRDIRLLDAFLRFEREQRLAAEREAAAQKQAAAQSAGSAGGLREDFDHTTLGFRRAFREALG